MPEKNTPVPFADYPKLRKQVETNLVHGQMELDRVRVETYWRTGKLINDYIAQAKATDEHYGHQVLMRLAKDLDLSPSLLARCTQFSRSINIFAGRQKSFSSLSWTHFRQLIAVKDEETRNALLERAEKSKWTGEELEQKIAQEVRKQPAPARNAPTTKLKPKLGKPYSYRITELPSIHKKKRAVVDLGFRLGLLVDEKKHKPGEIVESEKRDGDYALKKSPRTEADLFTYKAWIERVIDGDTMLVQVDLGFSLVLREYLRLRGLNAPELSTSEGKQSKAQVEHRLSKVDHILLTTTHDDKYGRYVADIFYGPESTYLNQELLDEGLAERY